MSLTDDIAAIAAAVYRELGAGHQEPPYQKAMEVGLRLRGLKFEAQKVVEIKYAGHYVGDCNVDVLVADSVAVELKAVGATNAADRQQLMRYMTLLGVSDGMLINFAQVPRTKKGGVLSDLPEIHLLGGAEGAA